MFCTGRFGLFREGYRVSSGQKAPSNPICVKEKKEATHINMVHFLALSKRFDVTYTSLSIWHTIKSEIKDGDVSHCITHDLMGSFKASTIYGRNNYGICHCIINTKCNIKKD